VTLAIPLLVAGTILGLGADFLSRRWPLHEEDYARRTGIRWQTVLLVATGAAVFALLPVRWVEPRDQLVLGIYCAALLVLLATDLDQKLLPDLITLPLIIFSGAVLLLGWSPVLADKPLGLVSGVAAGIGAPLLLFVSDRILRGELGGGDLKLAVSIGFMSGVTALVFGLLIASIGFSVILIALMVARRLSLKSAVPFGPVLIYGAFAAVLLA